MSQHGVDLGRGHLVEQVVGDHATGAIRRRQTRSSWARSSSGEASMERALTRATANNVTPAAAATDAPAIRPSALTEDHLFPDSARNCDSIRDRRRQVADIGPAHTGPSRAVLPLRRV
jgi:hypothetical protein